MGLGADVQAGETVTLPDLEPRSSTIDTIDAALWHLQHAREAVLREVAYLGEANDRLRAEYGRMKAERDAAIEELKKVIHAAR